MNKTERKMLDEQKLQQEFIDMVNKADAQPPDSLVKYGEPKVIAVQDKNGIFRPKYTEDDEHMQPLLNVTSVYKELRTKNQAEIDCSDKAATVQEILNKVFPPITWREEGKIIRRFVSNVPSTRPELHRLQTKLDELIKEKKLKQTGLCDERREIFDQCMDEMARQEIINCPPRGILLLRIRDELRNNLEVYESLYLSNAAYAVRKALRVESENENLQEELEQLKDQREDLINNINNVREQLSLQEEKFKRIMTQSKNLFLEERDNLRRHNLNLKSQLESMVQENKET